METWLEIQAASDEKRRELVLKGDQDHVDKVISLKGVLPSSLFDLVLLNFLDISDLPVENLPKTIGNLSNLAQLSIKKSLLKSLPDSVCDLKHLKLLNVSESQLESLPEGMGQLQSLHTLNVSSNNLGSFPMSISKCSALAVVDFSKNSFTEFPMGLTTGAASEKVAEVNGSHNNIGEVDDAIQNINVLKVLNLSNNEIKELPQAVAKCIKLKQVDFKSNLLKDKRLKKLIEQDQGTKAILDYIRSKGRPAKGGSSKNALDKSSKSSSKGARKKLKDEKSQVLGNQDDLVKHFIKVVRINEDPWTAEGEPFRVTVLEDVKEVRPYIVACILKNLDLTKSNNMFKNFITVQTRLHEDICVKRTVATIATHDMDELKGSSLVYSAQPAQSFQIRPLGRKKKVCAESFYQKLYQEAETARKESKRNQISGIHKYLSLMKDQDLFANLRRSTDNCVISLPPLTNCEETKISAESTDIFVEVTGSKSLSKCKEVMDELLKQLVEKGFYSETRKNDGESSDEEERSKQEEKVLVVQQVRCEDEDGKVKVVYPSKNDMLFDVPEIRVLRP